MVKPTAKTAALSAPDKALEERLRKRGVKFEYLENVSISAFDTEASANNQARLSGLNEPTVVKYQEALEAGVALPALLAYQAENGKLVIISGLHRLEAYTRAGELVNVYLAINASPNTRLELTFTENLEHGLPTDEDERLRHALHLVEQDMSAKDAARKLLVPLARLERERGKLEQRRRAIGAGLTLQEWEALPTSTRSRLYQVNTDEGFAELARLTVAAGLTGEEVSDIVGQINSSRSGIQQQALVQDLREKAYVKRVEAGGKAYAKAPGKKNTPRITLERTVTLVQHLPPAATLAEYYSGDRSEILSGIDRAIEKLRELRVGLNGS
jgi:hypothetical protein